MSTITVLIEDDVASGPMLIECDTVKAAILTLQELIGVDHRSKMRKWMNSRKKNFEVFTGAIYGWDSKDGKLTPNKGQQLVIQAMKTLYENGSSYGQIAKILNERGIKGAKGGSWVPNSISRTMNNKFHERATEF